MADIAASVLARLKSKGKQSGRSYQPRIFKQAIYSGNQWKIFL